jgi:predicted AAA+ superfamily ATPase
MISKNAFLIGIFDAIMPTMFTRELEKIETAAFLLGPRGTGKSTWIQQNYQEDFF